MASANLDLVRSIFSEWERGDFSSADWADPEITFTWADGPSPGRWTGLRGMSQGMRELLTAWEDYRVGAEDFRELDGQRVLVTLHARGRGKTSGIELGAFGWIQRGVNVFDIRAGRVTSIVAYYDRDRALADLGLEE
jgi:ketosteroid isomerase-like protein